MIVDLLDGQSFAAFLCHRILARDTSRRNRHDPRSAL
jgi:hypothetical protein